MKEFNGSNKSWHPLIGKPGHDNRFKIRAVGENIDVSITLNSEGVFFWVSLTERLIMNDSENMFSHAAHTLLKCAFIFHLKTSLYLRLTYFR